VEIERKWLVGELPADLDRCPSRRIRQGYVALEPGGAEVRVRDDGGVLLLTVKGAGDLAREEVEIPISEEQFSALWPLTAGRRVEKTRTLYGLGDAVIEVDVFGGDLAPLILAEVEFDSEQAAELFQPPRWMGREVTEDSRYKNRNLATARS
jgi:CYTH domain-containing protein